jgi:hypothetical protein
MSFYLNDFKNHLQKLADNVDLPYDEPAMRSRTTKTIEETYSGMGCSSCKKKQQLTEQATRIGPPNRIGSGGSPWTPAARSTADNTNWAAMMMKHKRNKRRPSSRWGGTGDGPPGGA